MSDETKNNEENFEEAARKDLESREYSKPVEKTTSLGKASTYKGDDSDEPALLPGFHEIFPDQFPSRGIFYPKDARFFIRAAQVKEIRHFSTIDERDPFSVDEALTEIIKGCLMVRFPGKMGNFKDLREEDRIHVILTIRALTFVDGENKLAVKKDCDDCGHENEILIDNKAFENNDPDEQIMRYYDEESRIFRVQTKSLGEIELTAPPIGTMMEVSKYLKRMQQEGKKFDQSFIKMLPYMIKDWRGFTQDKIKKLEVEFMQWTDTKYQVMNKLTEMVRVGVKEELKSSCEKCGTELRTPITFPGGIKSLFVISDISGELL